MPANPWKRSLPGGVWEQVRQSNGCGSCTGTGAASFALFVHWMYLEDCAALDAYGLIATSGFLFFSYQWLSSNQLGPNRIQLEWTQAALGLYYEGNGHGMWKILVVKFLICLRNRSGCLQLCSTDDTDQMSVCTIHCN